MNVSAYEGNQPYIFISYAHKDSGKVLPIIETLTASGFRIWYDAGIMAGTEWPEYIATKLLRSTCVIAFVSKSSLASQNCTREINYAISQNKKMLSIYLEDVQLSPGMAMQLGTVQGMYYHRSPFATFIENLKSAPILTLCRGKAVGNTTGTSATVTISKPSSDFVIENGVLKKYTGSDTNVTIPSSVTSIGYQAFKGCSTVRSVSIPNGVRVIDSSAFHDCNRLTSINIPDSVWRINSQAFSGCYSLKSVTIPNSVCRIDKAAFYGCVSLTIYCNAESKPREWNEHWNITRCPVVWGFKG